MKNLRFWGLNLGWSLSLTIIVILLENLDSLDFSYFLHYLDEPYNWIDANAILSFFLIKTWNISLNKDCVKPFINVDLNVMKLMFENINEFMIIILNFKKIEFFFNFCVN